MISPRVFCRLGCGSRCGRQAAASVRRGPESLLVHRAERDDAVRVDPLDGVVVALGVVEAERLGDARHLIELAGKAGEVRIVGDPPEIALEGAVIAGVEADQRDPEAPVSFGQPVADEVALPRQPLLKVRSEEHTSELQSLMRISYAV